MLALCTMVHEPAHDEPRGNLEHVGLAHYELALFEIPLEIPSS